MYRVTDVPVSKDGAVVRESQIYHLEAQEFSVLRVHYEFAIELGGSLASLANTFSSALMTANDCLYRHVQGIYGVCEIYFINFHYVFSYA